MEDGKILYVIGAVSGHDMRNRPAFERAREVLNAAGFCARIPHDFIRPCASWEEAMNVSLHVMTDYQVPAPGTNRRWKPRLYGVALLANWEKSQGARLEREVARALGIPCKSVSEWAREGRR